MEQTRLSQSPASLFKLSVTTLNSWRTKYQMGGFSILHNRTKCTRYPEELRMKAIHAVLTQEESLFSDTIRFNISSTSVLARWIRKYTSHSTHGKSLKERPITTKGRTTTFEERVQAVMDCIQSGKDSQRIMDLFNNEIITYRLYEHQQMPLVIDTLKIALENQSGASFIRTKAVSIRL